MGTGWRRAFCTTIPRESEESADDEKPCQSSSPNASPHPIRSCGKLGIFSSISNPSTPKLRCRTSGDGFPEPQSADGTPKLRCKTVEKKEPRKTRSTPSSPRTPFSIFKTAIGISKNGCGVCLQSVKTGQGMAIYTAECSHSFHFPCIAQLVRKQGKMVCPVCSSTWNEIPLLFHPQLPTHQNDVVEKTITTTSNNGGIDDRRIQSSISAVKTKHDHHSKPYNDDEPLLSPTAGVRFNPIPEAEDEADEDAQEFQGFSVNPSPSNNSVGPNLLRNVEVKLLPEAAVVSVGRSHETFAVALRVKAPSLSGNKGGGSSPVRRAPVDLVTVLDVSGGKLHMVKRSMRLIISSLGSADRLSIVSSSASSQRLLPLRRMSHQGQRLARRIVDHLSVGEGKSADAALKLATKVLEDRREKNPVASIVLLSDGQDRSSSKGSVSSSSSSAKFAQVEIPVSSFGYGGSYNQNQESTADAFAKRVGGLLSVVVQDLTLQLSFSSGEISAVYSSCNGRPSFLRADSVRLGELYAEEERELLVELRVPTSAIGSHHVMSVRCSYRDPATGEAMYGRERALLVPRPHVVRSSDPRIERLRSLFLATKAVAETRRLVERGELDAAQRLLVSARRMVAQSSSAASAEEYGKWLDAELALVHGRRQCSNKVHQKVANVDQQRRRRMGEHHVAFVDENGEPLTPTSAWRAAEQLAKLATMKKALNRSKDLHGFENARF